LELFDFQNSNYKFENYVPEEILALLKANLGNIFNEVALIGILAQLYCEVYCLGFEKASVYVNKQMFDTAFKFHGTGHYEEYERECYYSKDPDIDCDFVTVPSLEHYRTGVTHPSEFCQTVIEHLGRFIESGILEHPIHFEGYKPLNYLRYEECDYLWIEKSEETNLREYRNSNETERIALCNMTNKLYYTCYERMSNSDGYYIMTPEMKQFVKSINGADINDTIRILEVFVKFASSFKFEMLLKVCLFRIRCLKNGTDLTDLEPSYKIEFSDSHKDFVYVSKQKADKCFSLYETFNMSSNLSIVNDTIFIPRSVQSLNRLSLHYLRMFIESGIVNLTGFPCAVGEPKFDDDFSVKPEMKEFIEIIQGKTPSERIEILNGIAEIANLFSFGALQSACLLRAKMIAKKKDNDCLSYYRHSAALEEQIRLYGPITV
jgi:hypothetical protein